MIVTVIRGGVELALTQRVVKYQAEILIKRLALPLESPVPATLIIEDATRAEAEHMLDQAEGDGAAAVALARDLIERTAVAYTDAVLMAAAPKKRTGLKHLGGE